MDSWPPWSVHTVQVLAGADVLIRKNQCSRLRFEGRQYAESPTGGQAWQFCTIFLGIELDNVHVHYGASNLLSRECRVHDLGLQHR